MRLTVTRRIYFGFLCCFFLTAVVGGIGYITTDTQLDLIHQTHETIIPYVCTAKQLKIAALTHRRYEKDFFLNIGNPDKQKKYLEKFGKTSDKLKKQLGELLALSGSVGELAAETQNHIEISRTSYDRYVDGFMALTKTVLADPTITPQQANKLMTPLKDHIYAFEAGIDKLEEISNDYTETTAQSANTGGVRARRSILVTFFSAALAALLLSIAICRKIGRLMAGILNRMQASANHVASASEQVSVSSQSLSQDTAEQAAGIEETTSSLEEMAAMTNQNADNANQANQLMGTSKTIIENTNNSMEQLISAMDGISKASGETSKIIKTIDEIAFQTNLLALNAAVEAARAGEAGAGFAVVADEVRNLALRAAEAARSTADLIEDTTRRVQEGSELAAGTDQDFSEVSASAAKVEELIGKIATASREQALGIEQVNTAVGQMNTATQQNAASAEESAAASEELNAQADKLRILVAEITAAIGGLVNADINGNVSRPKRTSAGKLSPEATVSRKPEAQEQLSASNQEISPEAILPLVDSDFRDF